MTAAIIGLARWLYVGRYAKSNAGWLGRGPIWSLSDVFGGDLNKMFFNKSMMPSLKVAVQAYLS